MIKIFIPSYHRPHTNKTQKYFKRIGWAPEDIYTFVDSEADDIEEYRQEAEINKTNLVVFDMQEARSRYDYVHRAPKSLRAAGQARNMFQDYALENGIDFYVVIDDDTTGFQKKNFGSYEGLADISEVCQTFELIEQFMRKRKIGLFGVSQTGDFIGGFNNKLLRNKVMNTTFYLLPYIYRGERGVQDDDTSLFVGVMNEGYFTGSLGDGLCLRQTTSAVQKGGLTDLYHEQKLLNKSLVTPMQFPSAIYAERQVMNGGRLHHHIINKYLAPRLIKGERNNIAWDTYPEDVPFTNEPKNKRER